MNNSYKYSLYTSTIRIAANVLMLATVFWAMFKAAQPGSWSSETVFCLWFFGITIPIWTGAFYLNKVLRRRYLVQEESWIELPYQGRQKVRWSVADGRSIGAGIYR